jgi:hypothetical protein
MVIPADCCVGLVAKLPEIQLHSIDRYSGPPLVIADVPMHAPISRSLAWHSPRPFIDALCFVVGPTTIAGFISAFVVNSIQRKSVNWAPPNVLEPRPEVVAPFRTN